MAIGLSQNNINNINESNELTRPFSLLGWLGSLSYAGPAKEAYHAPDGPTDHY